MLKTIRAPKNLHYLTDRLPKSNYENGHEYEKVPKMNQSTKAKSQQPSLLNQNRNINLPKLDRIIIKNNGNNYKNGGIYHQPSYQERGERKQTNIDSILKIEGKNNMKYSESKNGLDRDVKAELRRIYNLKPSPQKHSELKPIRRNVKDLPGLPRIHWIILFLHDIHINKYNFIYKWTIIIWLIS